MALNLTDTVKLGEFITFGWFGDKGVILFNRPPFNFLNKAMCLELTRFLEGFSDSRCQGIVFATELDHFSAGADLLEHFPGEVEKMLPAFSKLCLIVASLDIPTVVAINGSCGGGGLEFARMCRMIVAYNVEKLRLSLPEITLNCIPPVALTAFLNLSENAEATIRFIMTGKALKGKNDGDLSVIAGMGLVDFATSDSLEQTIASVDFSEVAKLPKISQRVQKPIKISPGLIKSALAEEAEAIANLNPEVLEIAKSVLVACAAETSLEEALNWAEEIYLNEIAQRQDYAQSLEAAKVKLGL